MTRVSTGRLIFGCCLVGVAVLLGWASHTLLTSSETKLAEERFEVIADRALSLAVEITHRKGLGIKTLASLASLNFPDVDQWPYVSSNGFERLSSNLIETSSGRSMGLLPLVKSTNLGAFEDFAYNTVIAEKYPNETDVVGVSSFGKGVYGLDMSLGNLDKRYHEAERGGNTTWGSEYRYFAPYLFHSAGSSILMFNLHSNALFGQIMDDIVTCSDERATKQLQDDEKAHECAVLSDALTLTGETADVKSGPGAIMMEPIYPENNATTLVGFISSTIVWEETLVNAFSSQVSGVFAVLETETRVFTYEIIDGIPILV